MERFHARAPARELYRQAQEQFAKQTQSQPAEPAPILRGAPCPCNSGEKYKRCCGKNARPF
jgi:uncharacterized protein YecA (UPF0149 family)